MEYKLLEKIQLGNKKINRVVALDDTKKSTNKPNKEIKNFEFFNLNNYIKKLNLIKNDEFDKILDNCKVKKFSQSSANCIITFDNDIRIQIDVAGNNIKLLK